MDRRSGLHDHVGYWLRRLSDEVHLSFERQLADHGVTVAQWNVLVALCRGEGETVGEIARFLDMEPPGVSRVVDRLVEKELVVRLVDPASRRRTPLGLTAPAIELMPVLVKLADENDARFFYLLSEEQRHALIGMLRHLLEPTKKPETGEERTLMSTATENLQTAQARAMAIRPKVGGFPVLAKVLHEAGVRANEWSLPSAQSVYHTDLGMVVQQGMPIATGVLDIPPFDANAVSRALRIDQAGKTTLPEFLEAIWNGGVVRYSVDLDRREVTYYGADGDSYVERYPDVDLAEFDAR